MLISGGKIIAIGPLKTDISLSGDGNFQPLGINGGLAGIITKDITATTGMGLIRENDIISAGTSITDIVYSAFTKYVPPQTNLIVSGGLNTTIDISAKYKFIQTISSINLNVTANTFPVTSYEFLYNADGSNVTSSALYSQTNSSFKIPIINNSISYSSNFSISSKINTQRESMSNFANYNINYSYPLYYGISTAENISGVNISNFSRLSSCDDITNLYFKVTGEFDAAYLYVLSNRQLTAAFENGVYARMNYWSGNSGTYNIKLNEFDTNNYNYYRSSNLVTTQEDDIHQELRWK